MRSPKEMTIIQIEITNACVFTCSNCTRMCGHHAKPFMMDFETFKKTIDSLEGYGGTISIMGGEPTLHPEFEKFVLYLKSKYPHLYEEEQTELLSPMKDFMKTIQDVSLAAVEKYGSNVNELPMLPVPGLYSMLGHTYLKHFELIQDTFKRQVLNDHSNAMYHQPALITRKELGITDEEWIPLRDACWIQNTWSASVTPKGAFFCEIAAALDILFQGPGGWPIEKDWWKREPEDFHDQLHWCELCGFACETFTRNANEKIDDVSPVLYEKLRTVNSPKVKANQVNVVEIMDGVISEKSKASGEAYSSSGVNSGAPYIKYLAEKYDAEHSLLHPNALLPVYHFSTKTTTETMASIVNSSKLLFPKLFAICENEAVETQWNSLCDSLDSVSFNLEKTTYGKSLSEIIPEAGERDYLVFLSDNYQLTNEFLDEFKKSTTNPGTLIYAEEISSSGNMTHWIEISPEKSGFIAILNKNANSLRDMERGSLEQVKNLPQLKELWQKRKIIPFAPGLFVGSSKDTIKKGERCAIFGGGGRSSDIYYLITQQEASCVVVVDSNPALQGVAFENLVIQAPEKLEHMKDEIDRILVGSPIYFDEMKAKILELGFEERMITRI